MNSFLQYQMPIIISLWSIFGRFLVNNFMFWNTFLEQMCIQISSGLISTIHTIQIVYYQNWTISRSDTWFRPFWSWKKTSLNIADFSVTMKWLTLTRNRCWIWRTDILASRFEKWLCFVFQERDDTRWFYNSSVTKVCKTTYHGLSCHLIHWQGNRINACQGCAS